MTSYICENLHVFVHPAKKTERHWVHEQKDIATSMGTEFETRVCPECRAIHYTENPQPEQQTTNVYIYDLTTGPQAELDGLLAQGYRIVARYAKQYHLEKLQQIEMKKQSDRCFESKKSEETK